jgi:hypothetical protein
MPICQKLRFSAWEFSLSSDYRVLMIFTLQIQLFAKKGIHKYCLHVYLYKLEEYCLLG